MTDPPPPTTALARREQTGLERRSQTPWVNLRALARRAADRVSDRVRVRLELPDRREMQDLMDRLDRLDERLARAAERRAKNSVAAEP